MSKPSTRWLVRLPAGVRLSRTGSNQINFVFPGAGLFREIGANLLGAPGTISEYLIFAFCFARLIRRALLSRSSAPTPRVITSGDLKCVTLIVVGAQFPMTIN